MRLKTHKHHAIFHTHNRKFLQSKFYKKWRKLSKFIFMRGRCQQNEVQNHKSVRKVIFCIYPISRTFLANFDLFFWQQSASSTCQPSHCWCFGLGTYWIRSPMGGLYEQTFNQGLDEWGVKNWRSFWVSEEPLEHLRLALRLWAKKSGPIVQLHSCTVDPASYPLIPKFSNKLILW